MRAPAHVDVDALVAARGPTGAHRDLAARAAGDPRDVAARLALAALDDKLHRPSAAIASLEAVFALGGPLGVRWHADDQARLARLIAARGRARLARGAASTLADLERARTLGAAITDDELRRARAAAAIAALRHSDAALRASGRRTLGALATALAMPAWLGATGASPAARGGFGAWLWHAGARRAAWDELSAWHAATRPPRDPALHDAYLVAARWWTPLDRPGPPAADLVGPARCAFSACTPRDAAGDAAAERAYLFAPLPPPIRDPDDAAALVVIALHQALRGDAPWGSTIAARIDLAAFSDPRQLARLPRHVQPIIARLTGQDVPLPADATTPDQRLLLAAQRVLAGATATDIAALLDQVPPPYADQLRRIATTRAPFTGDAFTESLARHASLTITDGAARDGSARDGSGAAGAARDGSGRDGSGRDGSGRDGVDVAQLRAIAVAYRREPAVADRLGRDAVAGATDAAVMHAMLGALFDGAGDPARARASWQAAVDASPEPRFMRGLAEAQARQGDADAALINATGAAAASGDPAVVWTSVARELAGAGAYVQALDASRSAIDLSGPETLAAALDVAASASRALGRNDQAASLAAQRARLAGQAAPIDRDPTDPVAALAGHPAGPAERLWVASRWNPRNVELRAQLLRAVPADDSRRAIITGELVDLAGDPDPAVRLAAVGALHR